MNKQKLLLSIFIIYIFTISSAYATENMTDDIASVEESDNNIEIASEL